jgi:hypothetical protein
MRKGTDHFNKESPLKKPLLDKERKYSFSAEQNKKQFYPNVHELEKKYSNCTKSFGLNCNKTTYQDFICIQNEESKSLASWDFSAKSIIILILSIMISILQLCSYRKIVDFYNKVEITKNILITEYTLFCWRIQAIFLCLLFYIKISNFFVKKNMIEERRTTYNDFSNIHMFQIKWDLLITKESLKHSFFVITSSFLFLLSTKFLPLSFSLIFNSSGIAFNYYARKENKVFSYSLFLALFSLLGLVLFCMFSYNNNFNNAFYRSFIKTNDPFYKSTEPQYLFFMLGILLSFSSSGINHYLIRAQIKETVKSLSPLETIFNQTANSCLCSCIILIVLETLWGNGSIWQIMGWLVSIESIFHIGLILGLLGLLQIIFIIFSSIYLKQVFIRLFTFLEIIFVDSFAIYFFSLYSTPTDYIFYISLFQLIIALFFMEFANIFESNIKDSEKSNSELI